MTTEICDIVTACQRHEAWAQQRLYDRYSAMVMGVCLRYVSSREEVQDLVQDVFVMVFEKIDRLRNPEAVTTWIRRIALSCAVDFVSHNCEILVGDLSDIDVLVSQDPEVFDTDVYGVEDVLAAIRRLPAKYSLVFNMYNVDEMSVSEICESTGLKASTVRCNITRAAQMLREMLNCKN